MTLVTIETVVRTFSFSAEPQAFGSNSRLKHSQGQASSSADDGWSNFGTQKVPSINTLSQTYPFSMQTITVLLHMHANSSSWGHVSMEPKRPTAHWVGRKFRQSSFIRQQVYFLHKYSVYAALWVSGQIVFMQTETEKKNTTHTNKNLNHLRVYWWLEVLIACSAVSSVLLMFWVSQSKAQRNEHFDDCLLGHQPSTIITQLLITSFLRKG